RCTSTGKRAARTGMTTKRWSMSRSIRDSAVAPRCVGKLLAAATAACLLAAPAHAHGFGQRYDLPLPLSFYLFGTAAAVVVSFIVVGLFARHAPGARGYPRIDLSSRPLGRLLAQPIIVGALKLAAVGLLVLTILAGFFGDQNPYRNIAPTFVWIIFWVGLAVFSAFVG